MSEKKLRFKRTPQSVESHLDLTVYRRRIIRKEKYKGSRLLGEKEIDQITDAIRLGHHPEFAAASAGIQHATYLYWLRKGKKDLDRLNRLEERGIELREEDYSLYCELYVKTQQALFEAQDMPLRSIQQAASEGDWRAAAHFLERRFPQKWGRKLEQKIENENPAQTNVQTIIMIPKRAENTEEWNAMVNLRKKGDLEMKEKVALPGSSEAEEPKKIEEVETFESVMGIDR